MESNGGGDASAILRELETLKATKSGIEQRISALEAQLRDVKLGPPQNDAVLNDSSPPTSTILSGFGHGLSPDMIYRYSRHLLLPSFGVQGEFAFKNLHHAYVSLSALIVHNMHIGWRVTIVFP